MQKTFSFAGKKYRINIVQAAGTAFAVVCWLAAWGAFFAVVIERVLA